jgi:hypothetical protein
MKTGALGLRSLLVASFLLISFSHASCMADTAAAKYTATDDGIFKIDASGKRFRIAVPPKGKIFTDSIFSVSPNGDWALIDLLPRRAGPGRIEEIKVLVSLRTGSVVDPDGFHKQYGVWLFELAEWKANEPATVVMDDGRSIRIK